MGPQRLIDGPPPRARTSAPLRAGERAASSPLLGEWFWRPCTRSSITLRQRPRVPRNPPPALVGRENDKSLLAPLLTWLFRISAATKPSNMAPKKGDRFSSASDRMPSRWHARPESPRYSFGDLTMR